MNPLRSILFPVVLAASIALPGCSDVTRPDRAEISGEVLYPSGEPVIRAKVTAETGESTFSDAQGHYRLTVTIPGRRVFSSVTLTGRDGFTPGRAYVVTRHGTVQVPLVSSRIVRHIVLTESTPI